MSGDVKISRFRDPVTSAECEGCDRLHPQATRKRAWVHVQQTGHTVHVVVRDVTRYEPGQERKK